MTVTDKHPLSASAPRTRLPAHTPLPHSWASTAAYGDSQGSDWREEALCAQVDPEIFLPEKGHGSGAAKRVCATCPVRMQCLRKALEADERYGVWGGTTPAERRALRREAGMNDSPSADQEDDDDKGFAI